MRTMLLLLTMLGLTVSANAQQQTFHDRVTSLYSFAPHTLATDAQKAKSKELDAFWSNVKEAGPSGLENLREELRRTDSSPFFNYDGAKLLLSLSSTREDQTLALSAINRADLADVQLLDYFQTIHWFAVNEFDTSDAAFKILAEPDFKVFIAEHYLWLDQELCIAYMLIPTKEEFYLEKAEQLLFTTKDVTAQKSLLSLIANTVTKSGDETIARFEKASDQPEESRKFATMILGAFKRMNSAVIPGISTHSYDTLKARQRKLMARVSDEALDEWYTLRIKIRHNKNY